MMPMKKLEDELGRLAREGHFRKVNLKELDGWSRRTIEMYLVRHKIPFRVCDQKIGKVTLVKIDEPTGFLTFLVCMPEGSYDGQGCDQFCWSKGDDFADENCIEPNVVSMWLIHKETGTNIRVIADDDGNETWDMSTLDGRKISVSWPKEFNRKPPKDNDG